VRGAVSGVGLVDIWLAFYEILLWLRRRRGTVKVNQSVKADQP